MLFPSRRRPPLPLRPVLHRGAQHPQPSPLAHPLPPLPARAHLRPLRRRRQPDGHAGHRRLRAGVAGGPPGPEGEEVGGGGAHEAAQEEGRW